MMMNEWRGKPIGMTRRLPWDGFGQDLTISFYDGMSPFSRGFDSLPTFTFSQAGVKTIEFQAMPGP
jgi:hypothetical protein